MSWEEIFITIRRDFFAHSPEYSGLERSKIKRQINNICKSMKNGLSSSFVSDCLTNDEFQGYLFHYIRSIDKKYMYNFIFLDKNNSTPLFMEITGLYPYDDFFLRYKGKKFKNLKCPFCKKNQFTVEVFSEQKPSNIAQSRAYLEVHCDYCKKKGSEQNIRNQLKAAKSR